MGRTKTPRPKRAGDGLLAASGALSRTVLDTEVQEILADFRRMDTDEARGTFADHFLSRAGREMETLWPVFYEMLKQVEERKLYADPAFMRGKRTYASFAEYFEERVGRQFATWAELESTYHFVARHRPDLLKATLTVAQRAERRAGQLGAELGNGKRLNSGNSPVVTGDIITSNHTGKGTSADYLTLRLARDHPEIFERLKAGEYRSTRAAALEAGIIPRTQTINVDDPASAARTLRKYMSPDQLAELARLLSEG